VSLVMAGSLNVSGQSGTIVARDVLDGKSKYRQAPAHPLSSGSVSTAGAVRARWGAPFSRLSSILRRVTRCHQRWSRAQERALEP
ncbi:MAG: hypothetical protein E6614_36695, partial [Bradyrhizobium sp.]|nr:hypothetical protein [Bradyrhizobium sp.]MDU6832283.1 hypothetical protein [Bradyrhizobium sp.]